MTTTHPQLDAIILAAGKGTRMNSDLPKVLHPVADRPMVQWVIDACRQVGARKIAVIIGHHAELVRQTLAGQPPEADDLVFVEQTQQLGTGHAVLQAAGVFAGRRDNDVFVLCGDGPLIREQTLDQLLKIHRTSGAAATLATAMLDDPTGYGRIVRDAGGRFQAIVEQKDADNEQRRIREVNPSYYCFKSGALFDALPAVGKANAKGEYYLTDVLPLLAGRGGKIEVVDAVPAEDVLSINTPEQLAEVDAIMRSRLEASPATKQTSHTLDAGAGR
ncbi:MAG: sugar phosphate nucleotidyltransferase [Phycisphaerales bacterium]